MKTLIKILLPMLVLAAVFMLVCCTQDGKGEDTGSQFINDSEGMETDMKEYVEYAGSDSPHEMSLDGKKGEWIAIYDEKNTGRSQNFGEGRFTKMDGAVNAPVPGNFYQLSDELKWGSWWYKRVFMPDVVTGEGMRYFLRFGAVDYYCEVYLNGMLLGKHEGKGVGFEMEATEALRPGENNTLVVLVFQPGDSGAVLDGMKCGNIPKGLVEIGGINRSVSLYSTGNIALTDVFSHGDYKTGTITNELTISSPSAAKENVRVTVSVSESGSGICQFSKAYPVTVEAGNNKVTIESKLKDFKLWNTETPTLYNVHITVDGPSSGDALRSERTVRIGFRDFRIEDGWFFLNGERILLKSTHLGQTQPSYCYYQDEDAFGLKDMLNLKEAGFNCVRFLCAPATQVQLDLCDEIGLMVYQEHSGSWNWYAEADQWARRFDTTLRNQILADRNHPCIVIRGFLNEITDPHYCEHAMSVLPEMRALDPTRLFLFNSGRFDRQNGVGSVSNPESTKWEAVWGTEGKRTIINDSEYRHFPEYYDGCGDIHIYPREMSVNDMLGVFLRFGEGTKPVFVSEGGVGSAFNAIAAKRYAEQVNAARNTNITVLSKSEENILRNFLKEYDLSSVYPVAEDYYTDADKRQAENRRSYYDLLRVNGNLAGFSMTSALDEAFAAEGMFGFERQIKKEQIAVAEEGNAPLRWCLFTQKGTVYSTEEISLKAVLATEDVLGEGDYNATLRVFNEKGIVWEKDVPFTVKKKDGYLPLAINVFDKTIRIDGLEEGDYTFAAELSKGGYARADRTTFHVVDAAKTQKLGGTVYVFGTVDNSVSGLLKQYGAAVEKLSLTDKPRDNEVILIGMDTDFTNSELAALYKRIAGGAHAVFLYPAMTAGKSGLAYIKTGTTTEKAKYLMTENASKDVTVNLRWNWLYHSNAVAKQNEMLAGLENKGILGIEYFDSVLTDRMYFSGLDCPDELAVAEFGVGISCYSTETVKGTVLGSFDYFGGGYTLNGFDIANNIGSPTADRLLVNIIAHAGKSAKPVTTVSGADAAVIDTFFR